MIDFVLTTTPGAHRKGLYLLARPIALVIIILIYLRSSKQVNYSLALGRCEIIKIKVFTTLATSISFINLTTVLRGIYALHSPTIC